MTIIAVDDEPFALGGILKALRAACPETIVEGFRVPSEALSYAASHTVDVAFLDVEMPIMNGLELAKCLKEIYGNTNIIFITAFCEYALEAHNMHVSGFMLKPVSEDKVMVELDNLRHPVMGKAARIRVQTFGNFEVFVNNRPIRFSRHKSKEILAYLVDKNGTSVNKRELASILWEDAEYDRSKQQQLQELVGFLQKDLGAVGAGKILLRGYNSLSVNKEQFACDAYAFMNWDVNAINSYYGEYMSSYSWAEFKLAYIEQRFQGLHA